MIKSLDTQTYIKHKELRSVRRAACFPPYSVFLNDQSQAYKNRLQQKLFPLSKVQAKQRLVIPVSKVKSNTWAVYFI